MLPVVGFHLMGTLIMRWDVGGGGTSFNWVFMEKKGYLLGWNTLTHVDFNCLHLDKREKKEKNSRQQTS